MIQGVAIDMLSKYALPTVAMLSAFLDKEKRDYLDLITPFVLYCIPKKYDRPISPEKVVQSMKSEFGFSNIPVHVINKILSRLIKEENGVEPYIRRCNRGFYLAI